MKNLPIVNVDSSNENKLTKQVRSNMTSRRKEAEAKYERIWLIDPHAFDSEKNAIGRERVKRIGNLIEKCGDWKGKKVLDLGAGKGVFSIKLSQWGAEVDALDISKNALNLLKKSNLQQINLIHDALPNTLLKDESYDLILCTDVLALMDPEDYRLSISELNRLLKKEGDLICSTDLDFRTEGSLDRFVALIETEFTIQDMVLSYQALYIQLLNLLKTPSAFYQSWQNSQFKKDRLKERFWLWQWWWKLNSTFPLAIFWKGVSLLIIPFLSLWENNTFILGVLEKLCRFFWPESGINHVIVEAKKRPLYVHPSKMDTRPIRKYPKWE